MVAGYSEPIGAESFWLNKEFQFLVLGQMSVGSSGQYEPKGFRPVSLLHIMLSSVLDRRR
jgi:hypothetical protein